MRASIKTKEDIFIAALETFAAKGYSAATMDQIALRVGIKKPSLYNHYPGKEALLEEAYRWLRQRTLPEASAAPAAGPPAWASAAEALESVVRGFIADWDETRVGLCWTIVSEEQYVDPRAAALIFDVTEFYLRRTTALFEGLRSAGMLRFSGDARPRAETFAYALRAMHLEYGLLKTHGRDAGPALGRMLSLAARFAADR